MSLYGSQNGLNMGRRSGSRGDLNGAGVYQYARSETLHGGGGGGFEPYMDGYNSYTFSRSSIGGTGTRMAGGMVASGASAAGMGGPMNAASLSAIHQRALLLQGRCQEHLKKAEFAMQAGGAPADVERHMAMAKETIEQLKSCAVDLRQLGQPNDNVVRTLELCRDQLNGVHMAFTGSMRRRSTRGSVGASWEEQGRSFQDAMGWISQQKRLMETSAWGDDPSSIEQQLISHQKFHSSIQRSSEVDRARDELMKRGDRGNLHALDQEWDSLQQMSFGRTQQLRELQQIIQEISKEIMWVNDREEEELVFDWGDKNIDQYIPRKQESYSKLMSALEDKEKDLNKLKAKVDVLLKNNHPASDKIEAYQDTLQTQWSWLLQITKCIDTHLKENAAYSQFFKEANETYSALQNEHETVRKTFTCDKNTPLENLVELQKGLENEREKILEHKRQVQHLVNKSKSIVRLKPRNPEEKSSSPVIVKALCDFKQDQKVICKDNEAILKDNSQRAKWDVTGPGGLDMLVPSVCLIVPPPNPLSISLASKNDQYYEAILSIWSQLFINVKSLIAWQYCLLDIKRINSLTIGMLANMRPEEYRQIIKNLELHYEEFKLSSQGSQMFVDEDKRSIENQFSGAQAHYDNLVVQLPTYKVQMVELEAQQLADQQRQQQVFIIQQQAAEAEARRLEAEARRLEEEERRRAELRRKAEMKKEVHVIKKEVVKVNKAEAPKKRAASSSSRSLSELHALRMRLEAAEGTLSQHVHICLGDDGLQDCGRKIIQLESIQHDVEAVQQDFLALRDRINKELEGMSDADKAQFLRSELGVVNLRIESLEGSSSAYLQRLRALRDMLESVARAEDIIKVHEARLTEKETTSLLPEEVEEYMLILKNLKAELEEKKDLLSSMEKELANANHWNGQAGGSFHRCDMMLCKYSEDINLLSDRWSRILAQIDTRQQDLQLYLPELQHYKQTSSSLMDWIDVTRKKQDALQATQIDSVQGLHDHIDNQKSLNSEIKAKREVVESVLRDNVACVNSIKDYETDLASYASGLETLLNIPIKRTMLKSPSMDLNQEATLLQTRYLELLTQSGDYYKFLGTLLKNMEELKIRNTRIDLLEEELRLLRDAMGERDAKNRSLEDAVARYQLELSQSQDQLLSVEEVKRDAALQCSATKDSLDSTQGQLSQLNEELERLRYMLEEERRRTRLAEERYTQQQTEYDSVLRKRQAELETVSWSKVEVEKSVSSKDHEIEQLRRQLSEEAVRLKDLQREVSKVRSQCSEEIANLTLSHESQILASRSDIQRLSVQRDDDAAKLQLRCECAEAESRNLAEELRRLRMSVNQAEKQRNRAEEEARGLRSEITEEGRKRRELEGQVEALLRCRDEDHARYREELEEAMASMQEKSEQLVYVTHTLEEEARRRRTTEEGKALLEQAVAQMKVKLSGSSMAVTQLNVCEQDLQNVRLELEKESRERSRAERNASGLQGRIKDLQAVRDGLESQLESARKAHQEEASRRKEAEGQLEKTTTTVTEYTSTIHALRHRQEQASTTEQKGEEERLRLQEELERSQSYAKMSGEQVTKLNAELKALQAQLLQEQTRAKEANLRHEGLFRTMEEKSKALNESSAEVQRLQELTESQTKERLRLEEELRLTRHHHQELLSSKQAGEDQLSSKVSALELQLQASERRNADYQNLVSELSSERETLRLETANIQKQAVEISAQMKSIQSQYSEVVSERDALLLKLQMSEKDKERVLRLEEELSRIKLSLDSEIRSRQRLQEDNERVSRDLGYWKDQNESKQVTIRQYDADKERLEKEKNSLKSEIDRLMRELREMEENYKNKLSMVQIELKEVISARQAIELEMSKAADPSTVVFDGVRKPVTADKLLDCGILDQPTVDQLIKGHRTVPEVSADKRVSLKGTGPIAGVYIESPRSPGSGIGSIGPLLKMTFADAKKENLLPPDSVDLLLDAQAATGHIIDPRTNQKLTVDEACNQGVVDEDDRERLLAAEAAAVGYSAPGTKKPLSVFQAMKKGVIDKKTALRLLQAQESVGGILDPVLSVFLPKDTAIERNLIDNDINRALNQRPELYLDPDTEDGTTYNAMKRKCKVDPHTGLLLLPVPEKVDPSKLIFDGVRKPVTAKQLLDCGVLDSPLYKDLETGKKTVPEVSVDKNVNLKGTGPIAGVLVGKQGKMSLADAKKENLLNPDTADLLLEAQAATGHIIDPRKSLKLTVEEACDRGVVDTKDRDKLLAAEAAAVGFKDPSKRKPLSVFEAMRKGVVDKKTALRLLQAQESVGGILDPNLSVFLPKDTAIKRDLLDENIRHALKQNPGCYLDPDTDNEASYGALKRRCKTEPHTGLLLLPIDERQDPSKLIFDGVRKPVTAKQLLDCGVLDKPIFNQLIKGEKSVPDVSEEKKVPLKGTGSIAGIIAGPQGKVSLSEAKKEMLIPSKVADLLLEAQAATGHIIDPSTNQKLTVDEACSKGVVDIRDRDWLLAAEAAAVGFRDPRNDNPISVVEAMRKGVVDKKTALRLLQAQESAGGILDPIISVFLPRDTAIKRNILDESLSRELSQNPPCYQDPDTEQDVSYGTLKRRCKTEPHTGLMLLPVTERKDPSKLLFDGVRKPVTAQQLLDCGVLDKPTFNQLIKGEKSVPAVSEEKKVPLKGTGSIAGIIAGPSGKVSLSEAKKEMLIPPKVADLLLEAQAATGHIINPSTNQKLTVDEACSKGVVDIRDRDWLLAAEAAAVGFRDPRNDNPISVADAMRKGVVDKKTALRLLQAQESAGGILDPTISVFLPRDTAIKRNILDENLSRELNQNPPCYQDPDTEDDVSYATLKRRCKTDPHTGLMLLPVKERKDPSKLLFEGVRKPVTAQQLLDCGVLDKPTFNQLVKGEKSAPDVSEEKKVPLKGTGSIAGIIAGPSGKVSLSEAKKEMLIPSKVADLLLEAQAATGHIIDPRTNQKLTVDEACSKGVVDIRDRDWLLVAEAAAVGFRDPRNDNPISVAEAMRKGVVDKKTALRLLQAQESAGGILDPTISVFLPRDTAIKRNILDESLSRELNQNPPCYQDPDTEDDVSYATLKRRCKTDPRTGLILLPVTERKDPSKLLFEGVRKPVTAQQLLDCGVLDKPTFNQLIKGEKSAPALSEEKKVPLKGTGSIAGIIAGPLGKVSISEAKKQMLIPLKVADLLLEAQAATGHIIDPRTNQKLTVDEACSKGVVDIRDRDWLLAAEAAAVGFRDPRNDNPISVVEAMRKGVVDKKTALRLLQAQESAGGILDPTISVFLPRDTAIKRNLLDENLSRELNQNPPCYLDPDTERDVSYGTLKKRCKTDPHTGLTLLPVTERKDPSKLMFDGVRKPVSAKQLFESGVLDKPTFNQLIKGEKTVPEVSVEKMVFLKGTGPIAGVSAGKHGKKSLSEAKEKDLLPTTIADLLLEAQAATGYIIDPRNNQKLTVEEACAKGVVNMRDRDRLLVAEKAAVGFRDPSTNKPMSVFEAMNKGIIDKESALRSLQAQVCVGGILDPELSVFLPKSLAVKRNILDENLRHILKQRPPYYLDPDNERNISYGALKERCKTEAHTGLQILPISERYDPSKLLFEGVRKPVTAQQLLDCEILDKATFNQLTKGDKTVADVSVDKKIFLKGTGSIAGVAAGPMGKMSFTDAKKQNIMTPDTAEKLLVAQAATGHIIDPRTNQKLSVQEACARGVVDMDDESKLLAAEGAAIGYQDPSTGRILSVGQAVQRGLVDQEIAVQLLQAQESVGGILDPTVSVYLPKDIAMNRGLIDKDLHQALAQSPQCYLDPDTRQQTTYVSLKKKCKVDPHTGLLLLPEPQKPATVQGLRSQVSVIDLVDANLLQQSDIDKLRDGRLTSQDIEKRLRPYLGGSTCIAGIYDDATDKVKPFYQAMKDGLLRPGTTLELLEAQAASGFIIDPVNNLHLSVGDAYSKRLFGPEFKDNLLAAERAVTGYKLPGTNKVISLFQAIERGLVEKGHGIRLLEAQIASGGIIDPEHSHRIDVGVAYKRGYFNEDMNRILTDPSADTKGFFDPNTEENLTYVNLKQRCIVDNKSGLILLPIEDKKKKESTQKNTLRKRRVVIVDPENNKEMTVREAYDKGYIDYDTFMELSQQECEWEEIIITDPDGSQHFSIVDKKTGKQYDIDDLVQKGLIDQAVFEQYRSRTITLTEFADIVISKTKRGSSFSSLASQPSAASSGTHSGASATRTSTTSSTHSAASTTRTSSTSGSFSGASATGTSATSGTYSGTSTTGTPGASSTYSVTSTTRTLEASAPSSATLSSSSSSSSSSAMPRPLSPTLAKVTTMKTTTITERGSSISSLGRDSPDALKQISSISINLASSGEAVGEQDPIGAIFDTESLEKISVMEGLDRDLVDSITAQRLLEAQACTGGIINPVNGRKLSIQEASRQGIISQDMATKLKPAQKAFIGFDDVKARKKMSVAEAMKEMWVPYEAGQRFMEFQYVTGGLYDPEMGCRRSIDDALKIGWLEPRAAQKLQDVRHHTKNLTCPKTKLKITFKEALDSCMVEESTGVRMLPASSISSKGISSPYNTSSAPGSATGSRSGSRRSSRRSSVDMGSPTSSLASTTTSRYSQSSQVTFTSRSYR